MNIILTGFMGAGKSAVGKRLAIRLGYRFLDTDNYIEHQESRKITEIFAEEGEAYFRKLETSYLKQMVNLQNTVVSTGGGIVTTPGNYDLLKKIGTTIYLKAELSVIKERVLKNDRRPLLRTANPEKTIEDLFAKREHLYEEAELIIPTGQQKIQQVVNQIIREI